MQKVLTSREDYFNTKNTRNIKNTSQCDYNCGGYALRTFAWWRPFRKGYTAYDFCQKLFSKGYDELEMDIALLEKCVEILLEDFSFLEITDKPETDKRIIAFRIGTYYDFESELYCLSDWDFHFKVQEKNSDKWTHKQGGGSVTDTDCEEEYWEVDDFDPFEYTSRIIYFIDRRE